MNGQHLRKCTGTVRGDAVAKGYSKNLCTINVCLIIVSFIPHRLKASDIMESCLSYIYPHTRVHSIVGILKTTAHNAFPVVTIDKTNQQVTHENNFEDNVDSSNEQFARTTTFSSLTSEQKLRRTLTSGAENSLLHRLRTGSEHHPASHHINIKGKRLLSEGDQDSLVVSSSAPMVSNLLTNYLEHERGMADDNNGKCAKQDSFF